MKRKHSPDRDGTADQVTWGELVRLVMFATGKTARQADRICDRWRHKEAQDLIARMEAPR